MSLPTPLSLLLSGIRRHNNFNASEWISMKTKKLNTYMQNAKLSACVVSVSGGIDSAVTYLIALEASTHENSPIKKIVGIAQPIHSTQSVWKRALELPQNDLGTIYVVDQSHIFDALSTKIQNVMQNEFKDIKKTPQRFANGQLRSYMRTPVNYYVSQMLSATGSNALVLGTGNKDEDQYLAYFCKAGDGVVDVQLIADLHKSEVYLVGEFLGVPHSILKAPPTADLWENQTDEEELGFSYDFIELLLEYQDMTAEEKENFQHICDTISWNYFVEKAAEARSIHQRNKHKLNFPVNL